MTAPAMPAPIAARPAPRHLLTLDDLGSEGLRAIIDLAATVKADPSAVRGALAGGRIGMIFEAPSTRTRVSFEAAAWLLGALPIVLRLDELQLGRGETVADTARALSLYLDGLTIRAFSQSAVEEFAAAASIPVINALTGEHHPCQAMADVLTLREEFGSLAGVKVAFVGDGDNVCASLIEAAGLAGFDLHVATPPGYEPSAPVVFRSRIAASSTGGSVTVSHDPLLAVDGADAVYADVWTSIGHDAERAGRREIFERFRVDASLMSRAARSAIFLHCLPAHRGEEVTAEVIDGPQSRVWRQAENRLHTEVALLHELLAGDRREGHAADRSRPGLARTA